MDSTTHLSSQDLIRALLAKEPGDRPSIADIFDHRWLRSRYSGDNKELSSTNKSGANITFRNFEEYCGRGKFPEKIEAAFEIERRKKSVNVSIDNNASATTTRSANTSTSSSTQIEYQITRRKSLSADSEKDKGKNRERERERDRDRSGASPSQALSIKRRDKGMGGSQVLPSFRRHRSDRSDMSPSGVRSQRTGRQEHESVSDRSIGTIKTLPDLSASSYSEKEVSHKQTKAKRGSKQLIPIPSDLVRGRDKDTSDRDRERDTSRHSSDAKDHHRVHLRPI
jgi:serine/threonine protein kinase